MAGRWDKNGLPHKGWSCVGMEDLGSPDGVCDMCGKEEIRYVHFMEHPDVDGTVSTGCICAEKLEDEYGHERSRARRREARLKSAAGRRSRWPDLQGWRRSQKGNVHIRKGGRHVVIFASGSRFKFLIEGTKGSRYFSPRSYGDVEEAKLSAFDELTCQQDD